MAGQDPGKDASAPKLALDLYCRHFSSKVLTTTTLQKCLAKCIPPRASACHESRRATRMGLMAQAPVTGVRTKIGNARVGATKGRFGTEVCFTALPRHAQSSKFLLSRARSAEPAPRQSATSLTTPPEPTSKREGLMATRPSRAYMPD